MHFKLKLHPQVTSPGCVYPSPNSGSYWNLRRGVGSRCLVSTSTSSTSPHIQFPFPTHRNPTPHQIFHLPPGASQTEIKARCTPYFFFFLASRRPTRSGCRLRTCTDVSSRFDRRSGPPHERAPGAFSRHLQSLRHSPREISSGPLPWRLRKRSVRCRARPPPTSARAASGLSASRGGRIRRHRKHGRRR
jgi:hypothetical protein